MKDMRKRRNYREDIVARVDFAPSPSEHRLFRRIINKLVDFWVAVRLTVRNPSGHTVNTKYPFESQSLTWSSFNKTGTSSSVGTFVPIQLAWFCVSGTMKLPG
jgi:hypothetical protein